MIKMNKINKKIQIAISGGMGSMGKLLTQFIQDSDCYDIAGIYDPTQKSKVYNNFNSFEEIMADILFEFAPADQVNSNLNKFNNPSINLIVGSSGIDESTIKTLKKNVSEKNFICIIPNFSIGSSLQKIFTKILNDTFLDVKIEERHHSQKKDAPSGTAIDLAKSLINPSRTSSDFSETLNAEINTVNDVYIKSLRGDEFLAEQFVYLKNKDEKFTLGHVVDDRTAYLNGIRYLLDVHQELKGFHYGLESIMADRFKI
jgi:4-hydroxy-tetrahydrodipicolinate reductase